MKATLEFDLPEESSDHRMAVDGASAHLALWELDQHLRRELKHNVELPEAVYNALEDVRKHLWGICESHGLQIDD